MKLVRRKSERGNAMLEFALGFSLLWMLFSGIYQIGYAYYIYDRLTMATANAVQLGSRLSYNTGSPSTFTTALQNMVLYGSETAGTYPIVPNLTASNVAVNPHLDANGIPRYVTVNITGYTINALFTSFTLPNKPGATGLYYGQINCSGC
ncbi:MAG TPA: TadE/TadG family type IV pilus assembly protein [Bryobacteraceae bacterium]|nr:TadE/TadG family type IV pilus assembly protein [Bryobacteraceae bacterium]